MNTTQPNTKTQDQILKTLRDLVQEKGSQTAVAQVLKVTPQHVGDMLRGRRDVSDKIARRLGYEKIILFKKLEIAKEL